MALSPQKLDDFVSILTGVTDFLNIDRGQYSLSRRYIDFSPMTYAALRWIAAATRPTPTRLADHLGTAPATVTSLLDRLETAELLARAPSARDRRRIELHLTARGRRAADAIAADDRAHVTSMLSQLPKDRIDGFLQDIAMIVPSSGSGSDDKTKPEDDAQKSRILKTLSGPKPLSGPSLLGRKGKRGKSSNPSMATERRKPTRKPR